jgi:hypothetical protein
MQIFNKALLAACTPPDAVNTIVNCTSTMDSNVQVDHSQSSSDLLSQAVSDQANIGWEHFLCGLLSQCWRQVFISYLPQQDKKRETKADTWLWKVIHALWDYSFSIWEARNLTVHGRTKTAKEGKLLKTLKREVKTLYQSFATDPHMVPQSRRNLFDKPQDYLLQLPTSYIHCWLLSVQEAIETRKFRVSITPTPEDPRLLTPVFAPPQQQSSRRPKPKPNQSSNARLVLRPASTDLPQAIKGDHILVTTFSFTVSESSQSPSLASPKSPSLALPIQYQSLSW